MSKKQPEELEKVVQATISALVAVDKIYPKIEGSAYSSNIRKHFVRGFITAASDRPLDEKATKKFKKDIRIAIRMGYLKGNDFYKANK